MQCDAAWSDVERSMAGGNQEAQWDSGRCGRALPKASQMATEAQAQARALLPLTSANLSRSPKGFWRRGLRQ